MIVFACSAWAVAENPICLFNNHCRRDDATAVNISCVYYCCCAQGRHYS